MLEDAVEVEFPAREDLHAGTVVRAPRVAVPAAVDRVVGPAHLGGEIHELERELRGERVVRLRPPVPARRAGLHPVKRGVAALRRRVEVEDDVVVREQFDLVVAQHDHAPRRETRGGRDHEVAVGVGNRRESSLHDRRVGALRGGDAEEASGPVREVRLAERGHLPVQLHDGRHAHERILADRAAEGSVQERTLLRGPMVPVNREPRERVARKTPRRAVLREREQLEAGLRGNAVAEGHTAVVGAHDHVQQALRRSLLAKVHRELVRVVAHKRLLVETVRPDRVKRAFLRLDHLEGAERTLSLEGQSEAGRQDHRLPLAHHLPGEALLGRDRDGDLPVRRRHRGRRGNRRAREKNRRAQRVPQLRFHSDSPFRLLQLHRLYHNFVVRGSWFLGLWA